MGGEGSLFAQLYPPLIMATLLYRALKTLLSTAIAGTTNGNTAVTATQNGSIRFPPSFCHMKGSHISCFTSTINTMRYPTNIQRKRAIVIEMIHSWQRAKRGVEKINTIATPPLDHSDGRSQTLLFPKISYRRNYIFY